MRIGVSFGHAVSAVFVGVVLFSSLPASLSASALEGGGRGSIRDPVETAAGPSPGSPEAPPRPAVSPGAPAENALATSVCEDPTESRPAPETEASLAAAQQGGGAEPNIIFVDASVPDGGNGTAETPYREIQEAIDAAHAGQEVRVAGGLYQWVNQRGVRDLGERVAAVFMKEGVDVVGAGMGVTIIDCDRRAIGVVFDHVARAGLSGFTIRHCVGAVPGGGGILSISSSPLIVANGIMANETDGVGLGILVANGGTATIRGNRIVGNENAWDGGAESNGGGVAVLHATAVLEENTITDNRANSDCSTMADGGGLWVEDGSTTLSGNVIARNHAGRGVGIFLRLSAMVTSGDEITDNYDCWTRGSGGGIFSDRSLILANGVKISGNQINDLGAGIRLQNGSFLTLTGSSLTANYSDYSAGGLAATESALTLELSQVIGNIARVEGGGLLVSGSVLNLWENEIRQNRSNHLWSGGMSLTRSTASILGNSISNNACGIVGDSSRGGGVTVEGGSLVFASNLVAGNTAPAGAAGMLVQGADDTIITNNTFWGNVQRESYFPHVSGTALDLRGNARIVLANNLIVGNRCGLPQYYPVAGVYFGPQAGSAPPRVLANDLFDNFPLSWHGEGLPDPTGVDGNVAFDPLLVDPAAGDFSLAAGSPVADIGVLSIPGLSGTDRAGQPRVVASGEPEVPAVDLGGLERQASDPDEAPVVVVRSLPGVRRNGSTVVDASRSYDPDGDEISFLWSQTGGPPLTIDASSAGRAVVSVADPARALGAVDLPAEALLDVLVTDGRTSGSQRSRIRIGPDGNPAILDLVGYRFLVELGLPAGAGGIAIDSDGSTLYAIAHPGTEWAEVFGAAIDRDAATGRPVGLRVLERVGSLPFAEALAFHRTGTFVATTSQGLVQRTPLGILATFELRSLGVAVPTGLEFIDGAPHAADALLVVDGATNQIHRIELEPLGDGTFLPSGSDLFADLRLAAPFQRPIRGITVLPGDAAGSVVLQSPDDGRVVRLPLDAETGFPVGGPASPVVDSAYDSASDGWSLIDLATDPVVGDVYALNRSEGFPARSILQFAPTPRDFDRDGVDDAVDDCPTLPDPGQLDSDADGLGDSCDNNPMAVTCYDPPDADQDGHARCVDDCDDTRADVYSGANEACDGLDNDCDGSADEGFVADVQVEMTPALLWPPNHALVEVHTQVVFTGACLATCGSPRISLVSITSSDADGLGDERTADDVQDAALGTEDFKFKLRAERNGRGAGRVYTATYQIIDCGGNVSVGKAFASVPHDRD